MLNATVDEIGMVLSCIAVWRVDRARPVERGELLASMVLLKAGIKGRT